jgi:hypothetical protein
MVCLGSHKAKPQWLDVCKRASFPRELHQRTTQAISWEQSITKTGASHPIYPLMRSGEFTERRRECREREREGEASTTDGLSPHRSHVCFSVPISAHSPLTRNLYVHGYFTSEDCINESGKVNFALFHTLWLHYWQ